MNLRNWQPMLALPAAALLGAAVWLCPSPADEPAKPAEGAPLIVIDANGKEQKLKTWKFTTGTRPISWLAPPAPKNGDDPKDGDAKDGPKDGKAKGKPRQPAAGPEAL